VLSRITQWFNRKTEPKTEPSEHETECMLTAAYSNRIFEEINSKFNPKTDSLVAPVYMNELLGVLLSDEQWVKTIFMPNVHRLSIIRTGYGYKLPEEIDIDIDVEIDYDTEYEYVA
jgi:hypothetical protein